MPVVRTWCFHCHGSLVPSLVRGSSFKFHLGDPGSVFTQTNLPRGPGSSKPSGEAKKKKEREIKQLIAVVTIITKAFYERQLNVGQSMRQEVSLYG